MADGSVHPDIDISGKDQITTLHDLASWRRWVAWQTEKREGGKPTKVPYSPGTTRKAESDDPSTWGIRSTAQVTADRLPKPFGAGGVGIELGDLGNGLALGGIDLDTCRDPDGTLARWAAEIMAEFATYAEVSPSATGIKLFFIYDAAALPDLLRIMGTKTGKQWKRKSAGDHPPAIELYLRGRFFAVTDELHPDAPTGLRHVPAGLLQRMVTEVGPAFVKAAQEAPGGGAAGGDRSRSAAALKLAGEMRRAGATYDQWVARARTDPSTADWCREKGEADGQRQLKRTWDKAGETPPSDLELTEDGVAIRFAERYANELRFCHDARRWYHWKGSHWRENRDQMAFSWARELVRTLNRNAEFKTKALTGKTAFAAGVERFAQSDRTFAVTAEIWDTDPWLLGTPDGTVDLRTGQLRPAKQKEFITKITAVAPAAPGATCDTWLRFLDEATGRDDELIHFLKQWCGYCLTGITEEHALLFIFGAGGNGKSVLVNTLAGILADYARTAAMDTFTASQHDKHSTDLAMLRGARVVTASETEQDRAWAEARIKQMTGGDLVTARFMHRNNFTFRPAFKLTIAGNHKPVLKVVDEAARRRFNIVPFTRTPAKPNPKLEEEMRQEWPAILRWMIEGCLDWQKYGLIRPAVVVAATADYFQEQDVFGAWVTDSCTLDPTQSMMVRPSKLLESFSEWAQENGERSATRNQLRSWIERQSGLRYKRVNGADHVAGIAIKPPPKRYQGAEGADGGGRD